MGADGGQTGPEGSMSSNKRQDQTADLHPCERCGKMEPELQYHLFGHGVVKCPDPAFGQFVCPECAEHMGGDDGR